MRTFAPNLEYLIFDPENTRHIASGGFGRVEKATYLGTPVAVKTLTHHNNVDFIKEIATLSEMQHPNIIGMIAYNNSMIIMPRSDGNASFIATEEEFKIVGTDCLRALAYMFMHGPTCIMHGDIKPANILVERKTGFITKAMLGDVGLSNFCNRTTNNAFFGTRGYVPYGPPNELTDLFALATSLMTGLLQVRVKTTWPVEVDGVGNNVDNIAENLLLMPANSQPALQFMIDAYRTPGLNENEDEKWRLVNLLVNLFSRMTF